MRTGWRLALGIGVSGFFIWLVLRGVDPAEVIEQISQANVWYFLASIFVGTAGYFVRALRWKVLLHPLKPDTALRSRFAGVSIGFAINNLIPARVGELARAFALTRVEPITLSGSVGSLVVERFLDSIVLVTLFLVPMALPSFPGAEGFLSGAVGALLSTTFGLLAIALAGLIGVLIFPEPIVRLAERLFVRLPGGWGPRMVGALESFLQALKVLRHPVLLIKAVVWELCVSGFGTDSRSGSASRRSVSTWALRRRSSRRRWWASRLPSRPRPASSAPSRLAPILH